MQPFRHLVVAAVLFLGGCATQIPTGVRHLDPGHKHVELRATPFFPQDAFQCGPAALATVLRASGVGTTPRELKGKVYIPGRRGSLQVEMLAATRGHGVLPYRIDGTLDALARELRAGRPVLVFQNVGYRWLPVWHYAVVIGLDPAREQVILRSGTTRRLVMDTQVFLETWQGGGYWALVILQPGEFAAATDRERYLRTVADLESVGRVQSAHAYYAAAVDRWPDSVVARLGVANTLYAMQRPDDARAAFEEALRIAPDNVVALNNYGLLLAETGCPDRGLDAARRAHDLAPDALRPAIAETLREIRAMPAIEGACAPDPEQAETVSE